MKGNDLTVRIFLTNLGKYNEGELIGQWLKLPCSEEEIKTTLINIGINRQYEEYFITDFDNDIGLQIGEYENLQKLNEIAEAINSLNDCDLLTLKAVIEHENPDISKMETILDNLDEYILYTDITDDRELGYYHIHESGDYNLESMGKLADYLDYETFGRNLRSESSGGFTSYGWLEC